MTRQQDVNFSIVLLKVSIKELSSRISWLHAVRASLAIGSKSTAEEIDDVITTHNAARNVLFDHLNRLECEVGNRTGDDCLYYD